MQQSNLSLIVLFFLVLHQSASTPNNVLWPQPSSYTSNPASTPLYTNPCFLNYTIQSTPPSVYPRQLLDFYLTQLYECFPVRPGAISVLIVIKNSSVMTATSNDHQKYQINLKENYRWEITADYYVGYTRAIQTFFQLFRPNNPQIPQLKYVVQELPITIIDAPQFYWRGVMIDTARHYLDPSMIMHTLDGMLYNKLNVLHWHIIDQDSFPMQIPTRPQLSQYGKFSLNERYPSSVIDSIIRYAKVRGIRVIPQIDTPAHTQSWGRSPKLSSIVMECNGKYQGQFDPTLNLTYQVVKDVMQYINTQFEDNIVHFGGDQIETSCYDQRPSIKQFMTKNNISDYKQLQIYYRKEQRKIFKAISNKTVIYWANQDIDLPVDQDDIIHWWGVSKNVDRIVGRNNRVVLSNYDKTYMDVGFGDWQGTSYLTKITWRDAYSFQPRVPKVNVIGGQACMWSQLNTAATHDQKLWIRSSSIAERLWNDSIDFQTNMANVVKRLVTQAARMKKRGFKPSAVSVGLCEKYPQICFDGTH